MHETFASHSSSLSKAGLVRADPLRDRIPRILRTHRNPLVQLGNTGLWPLSLRSIGRQLRDAPSDWRRSSFAFPDLRRFHILSCPSTPGRRGHIRRITRRHWLLRPSQGCLRFPALRLGRPRTAWPGATAFPCSACDTGEFRFALLHRQSRGCAPGHVRRPGLDCVPVGRALNSLVWLFRDDGA